MFKGLCGWVVYCSVVTACGDDDAPDDTQSIVGEWQKYQRIDDDGSISEGDPDEFWVYNADGTFQNIDGGDICDTGTYTVSGNRLTITAHEVDDASNVYVITGSFSIADGFMTYTFVYDDDPEYPETLVIIGKTKSTIWKNEKYIFADFRLFVSRLFDSCLIAA